MYSSWCTSHLSDIKNRLIKFKNRRQELQWAVHQRFRLCKQDALGTHEKCSLSASFCPVGSCPNTFTFKSHCLLLRSCILPLFLVCCCLRGFCCFRDQRGTFIKRDLFGKVRLYITSALGSVCRIMISFRTLRFFRLIAYFKIWLWGIKHMSKSGK